MLMNLTYGFLIMALCLALQSVLLLAAFRYYMRRDKQINSTSMMDSVEVVNIVMLILVLGNLGQIAVWALVFQWLGEFTEFSEAFYHSAVNFSTLGYGDIVMSEQHRLLGPLQAINGIVMIGVSTASLMSVFTDALQRTRKARQALDEATDGQDV